MLSSSPWSFPSSAQELNCEDCCNGSATFIHSSSEGAESEYSDYESVNYSRGLKTTAIGDVSLATDGHQYSHTVSWSDAAITQHKIQWAREQKFRLSDVVLYVVEQRSMLPSLPSAVPEAARLEIREHASYITYPPGPPQRHLR
ncbi:hypothetical protein NM688_g6659 [Phlebia brevispora]|uniref:Uncharacterized protein n=1 Tax=Phlebia brevispora TaxID=194682 RepID=A0ACC1SE11_9APHY|nr:hypothetical protein NM688_g6659 [Phlebia brevispora]